MAAVTELAVDVGTSAACFQEVALILLHLAPPAPVKIWTQPKGVL
jgi:hypothetical protein